MQGLIIIGDTTSMRFLPTEHFVSTSEKTMVMLFLWKRVMGSYGDLLPDLVMGITMDWGLESPLKFLQELKVVSVLNTTENPF